MALGVKEAYVVANGVGVAPLTITASGNDGSGGETGGAFVDIITKEMLEEMLPYRKRS